MRVFLTLFYSLLFIFTANAQYWTSVDASQVILPRGTNIHEFNGQQEVFKLDIRQIKELLRTAPKENLRGQTGTPIRVTIPSPDGTMEVFEIINSSPMPASLAAKYPEIQMFKGNSVHQPNHLITLGLGYKGFHAVFQSEKGLSAVTTLADGQQDYYASYFVKDQEGAETPKCGVTGHEHFFQNNPFESEFSEEMKNEIRMIARGDSEPVELVIYDVAIACVGEFGQRAGSKQAVMDDFNLALGIINMFYEQNFAIRFNLIANNDTLISLDPATDNYNNATNGGGLLGQNITHLNGVIGVGNYDIGHVFTVGCGGGLAGIALAGSTCTSDKAGGVTCMSSANIVGRVTNTMTHEVAHQFSADHTWNTCGDDLRDQRRGGAAFEPGSGSTIMSYKGSCGTNNISGPDGFYFHVGTLDQVYFFSRQGTGAGCADYVDIQNNTPEVVLPYQNGFYIPPNTPFELTAIATDPEGDDMTYCWEQYNTGPELPLGTVIGSSPAFRSYDPTTNPTRTFPPIETIVFNRTDRDPENVLVDYDRKLNFRCTVRDNNPIGGGNAWEEVEFNVSTTAGPFRVTFPTLLAETFEVGDFSEIKWAVADTDNSRINCQRVNIKLSVDGGYTYPYTLAENVPNNGSRFVTIPDVITTRARIRVEAADNIFFDISNNNFIIREPSKPGYSLSVSPFTQQVCLPQMAEVDLITSSLLAYDSLITFEVNGLPAGAQSSFSNNPARPSEGSILSIDMSTVTADDTFALEIIAIAPNADTSYRTVFLEIVNSDFSLVEQLEPADGTTGLNELPTFTWVGSPNANTYDVQISTSPTFEASTIVDEGTGIVGTSYSPMNLLEKGTPYFWRLRPVNECGAGAYEKLQAFHTETLSCAEFESSNVPVFISSAGLPTVTSELILPQGGAISDINVTKVKGQHDLVKHIDVSLVGPDMTEVLLMSEKCGNTQLFDLGFDDQAPTGVPCPPNDRQVHIPDSSLSAFNGKDSEGVWELKIQVTDGFGNGGAVSEWGLQVCASVSLNAPFLVNNEPLAVKPGEGNPIMNNLLLSEDNDNTADELIYTVVENTAHGTLYLNNAPLGLGSEFKQSDIDNVSLRYEHNGNMELTDAFFFSVRDGEGGWFGVPRFIINIDENATTSTTEIEAARLIKVFPNPAQNELNIVFKEITSGKVLMDVIDIQGRNLLSKELNNAAQDIQINTTNLADGVYFIRIQTEETTVSKKITIQR